MCDLVWAMFEIAVLYQPSPHLSASTVYCSFLFSFVLLFFISFLLLYHLHKTINSIQFSQIPCSMYSIWYITSYMLKNNLNTLWFNFHKYDENASNLWIIYLVVHIFRKRFEHLTCCYFIFLNKIMLLAVSFLRKKLFDLFFVTDKSADRKTWNVVEQL